MEEKYKQNPIHDWFGLTYASYLTIPRVVLQGMPDEWQQKLIGLLDEMNKTIEWEDEIGNYHVTLRDDNGRIMSDTNRDYRYGKAKYKQLLTP